jgi:hypothetical protein
MSCRASQFHNTSSSHQIVGIHLLAIWTLCTIIFWKQSYFKSTKVCCFVAFQHRLILVHTCTYAMLLQYICFLLDYQYNWKITVVGKAILVVFLSFYLYILVHMQCLLQCWFPLIRHFGMEPEATCLVSKLTGSVNLK